MSTPCGCSDDSPDPAAPAWTPGTISNRPGLGALAYRIGTWSSFMQTMQGRIASLYNALPAQSDGPPGPPSPPPMTREPSDPAFALLDAWAIVADVITFYQERIANEGYVRTATEVRSLQELAKLVNYRPRPGVAASTTVAYTVQDQGTDANVSVPAGSAMQTLPVAGEIPQVFETSTPLTARASWTALAPRIARAQQVTGDANVIYVNGTSTRLKANDPLLIVEGANHRVRRIESVSVDVPNKRITLMLQSGGAAAPAPIALAMTVEPRVEANAAVAAANASAAGVADTPAAGSPPVTLAPKARAPVFAETVPPLLARSFSQALVRAPSAHPANAAALAQSLSETLRPDTDTTRQMLVKFAPALQGPLDTALRNTTIAPQPDVQVFAFNVQAAPFGSSAPLQTIYGRGNLPLRQVEWSFGVPGMQLDQHLDVIAEPVAPPAFESPDVLYLDGTYDRIIANSWIIVFGVDGNNAPTAPVVSQAAEVHNESRADYGISAKTTRIKLANPPWFDVPTHSFKTAVRGSVVYAQSEALDLAQAPVTQDIAGATIELDDLHDGMAPGQWLVISGERTDVPDTQGVNGTELVMLASAQHAVETEADNAGTQTSGGNANSSGGSGSSGGNNRAAQALLPGGRMRTTLILSAPLAYVYKRESITLSGNVTTATHGETHTEILGSGDGRAALRTFTLRRSPLTYVPAPSASGIASTLAVTVNGVAWREVATLRNAGPNDRVFTTRTLADGTTQVSFGNGTQGANLPSGIENVQATYRTGIGSSANGVAGQVSQLVTRPLGVMSVVNPIGASGGADPDGPGEIRQNMTLGLASLDRLVSVSDFEDFCRHFAGVAKASAVQVPVGAARLVHVTIAAKDDAPLNENGALLVNLRAALAQHGDLRLPVRVAPRDVLLLVISARVRVTTGNQWSDVAPRVRAALLDTFGFERRALGQPAALSEAIAAMQGVAGVEYVDVDVFDRVAQETVFEDLQRIANAPASVPKPVVEARLARRRAKGSGSGSVRAAQIAWLSADVPGTLTITEIAS